MTENDTSKKLLAIQQELNAPKSFTNTFGGYRYRSAEGILEALKPLLAKHECTLTLTDAIIERGGWVFVEATAALRVGREVVAETKASARHEDQKKGMDASQVSGACSSYARKYALNGLFLIDDARDSDSTNTHGKDQPAAPKCELTKGDIDRIKKAREAASMSQADIVAILKESPFFCENPPHDLLRIHVGKLLMAIEGAGVVKA